MKREEVLKRAKEAVCTDREGQYGSPEDNFGLIAFLWSLYLEESIQSADVAVMMILL